MSRCGDKCGPDGCAKRCLVMTLECTLVASIYGVIDMPDSEEAHIIVKTPKGNEFTIPATWETAKALSGRNGTKVRVVLEPISEEKIKPYTRKKR